MERVFVAFAFYPQFAFLAHLHIEVPFELEVGLTVLLLLQIIHISDQNNIRFNLKGSL